MGTNLPDDDCSHSVPCVGRNHAHTHTHPPRLRKMNIFPYLGREHTLPCRHTRIRRRSSPHKHCSTICVAIPPFFFLSPQLSCVRAQIRLKQVMKHLPLSRLTVFVCARPWSVDDGQIKRNLQQQGGKHYRRKTEKEGRKVRQ